MQHVALNSSMMQSAGYDPQTRTLEVRFASGETYAYANVPPELYHKFSASESKGKFFASEIRGNFSSTKVEPQREPAPAA